MKGIPRGGIDYCEPTRTETCADTTDSITANQSPTNVKSVVTRVMT